MKLRSLLLFAAASLSFAVLPKAALADSLTIGNPSFSTAGGVLTISGTFTNTSGATEYLNADDYTISVPGSSVDDSPFYFGAASIAAGQSLTEQLFSLTLPATAAGSYNAYFSILGGADANALNTLATSNFTVNVAAASSVTPEPSTWLLLGTGVLGLGFVMRRRSGFAAPLA